MQFSLPQEQLTRVLKQSWWYKHWGSTLCLNWHTQTQNDLMPCCKTCFLELSLETSSMKHWEIHWKKFVPSLILESLIVRCSIESSLLLLLCTVAVEVVTVMLPAHCLVHQCYATILAAIHGHCLCCWAGNNWFRRRIDSNRFSRANRIELPSSSICLAICKAGASSACLLVTKLAWIMLYYNFKHFTNILMHIYT